MAHDEARYKAKERIVDFAVFRDDKGAAVVFRNDLVGPGPAVGKVFIRDARNQFGGFHGFHLLVMHAVFRRIYDDRPHFLRLVTQTRRTRRHVRVT